MSERKMIDCHTHLMWYPDHISEQYAEEALASKLVKLKRSGGLAYSANLDKHVYDSTPESHLKASEGMSHVVVFGLQAKASGLDIPNEVIADYVAQHPGRMEGWASVDPTRPDCIEHLEYCVNSLRLNGLNRVEQLGLPTCGIRARPSPPPQSLTWACR